MRRALLYVLAGVLLVVIVAVAWSTRESGKPISYTVQAGDTPERIAQTYGVTVANLVAANPDALADGQASAGETLTIPRRTPAMTDVWLIHGAGVASEIVGVLIGFWLVLAGGALARRARAQVLSIGVLLAVVSYVAGQVTAGDTPVLAARFLFDAFKDGFFWVALFALFTQVLRMRDIVPEPGAATGPGAAGTGASETTKVA